MNLERYFERIGYTGDTTPTIDTLKAIHQAHLRHVPFENLNIHIPRPIILDETALYEKIVHEQRGGFCFEQNGLFYAVLETLGYAVQRLEANVYHADEDDFGISMNHMCLLVTIDGVRYLADVGFGASFIDPLDLDNRAVQVQDSGQFKVRFEGDTGYFYSQPIGDDEMNLAYRFFLEAHDLADYETACQYMQTSPKTHFTQKRLCSQWMPEGRVTLSENKLISTTWQGARTEIPISDENHFHQLLADYFSINIKTRPPHRKP